MLYACGSNGNGQLGLGDQEDRNTWTLVDIDINDKPLALVGGGNHTVLVDSVGTAYITRDNRFVSVNHPDNKQWKLASATWDSCFLVDDDNSIYEFDISGWRFILIAHLKSSIFSIKSGLSHTVLLADDGLYGWGNSRRGQCGKDELKIDTPEKFNDIIVNPDRFACGKDFTVILKDEELHILGNSRRFGANAISTSSSSVLSSWSSVLLLDELKMLGNNSHGQYEIPIENDEHIDLITLGSEHGLLVSGNSVRTWGWGEHGNCPMPTTIHGVKGVYAGCATSFLFVNEEKT